MFEVGPLGMGAPCAGTRGARGRSGSSRVQRWSRPALRLEERTVKADVGEEVLDREPGRGGGCGQRAQTSFKARSPVQ